MADVLQQEAEARVFSPDYCFVSKVKDDRIGKKIALSVYTGTCSVAVLYSCGELSVSACDWCVCVCVCVCVDLSV